MESTLAADGFLAMGSEPRLGILRALVRAGDTGLAASSIGEKTGIPASTLNHHLRMLLAAGLVSQERQGRSVVTRARFDHLEALAQFILSECCQDMPHE